MSCQPPPLGHFRIVLARDEGGAIEHDDFELFVCFAGIVSAANIRRSTIPAVAAGAATQTRSEPPERCAVSLRACQSTSTAVPDAATRRAKRWRQSDGTGKGEFKAAVEEAQQLVAVMLGEFEKRVTKRGDRCAERNHALSEAMTAERSDRQKETKAAVEEAMRAFETKLAALEQRLKPVPQAEQVNNRRWTA